MRIQVGIPILSARYATPQMKVSQVMNPVRMFSISTMNTDSDDDADFDLFEDIKEVLTQEET